MPSAARSAPACACGGAVPAHAVVGEVRQRVAERRQLPVEHREDARLGGVEDHVVEPVVAVHDARLARRAARGTARQPVDQRVGGLDALGLRGAVLARPARHLAPDAVARLAVVGQADGGRVDAVQRRDHAVHLVVVRGALGRRHAGQRRVPQDAAVDAVHHVEGAAITAGSPHSARARDRHSAAASA